jgi:transposase InsO family protein
MRRFGQVNQHNASIPRDHWITDDEKEQILVFTRLHPLEGYRRLAFMMLDADVVACSPSTVYRVLKNADMLAGSSPTATKKGTGFVQPLLPHEHWHVDISYLNIGGTFYFLCSVLDGYSRFIVHWEIREKMEEQDVEIILQRAREAFPGVTPRIISDNGPQFIANEFKEFVRQSSMTHVKTSPYYPQSNGKIERWHKTIKGECIRKRVPLTLEEARRIVAEFVAVYNTVRLHSSIGYVTPKDKLEGRDKQIAQDRKRKLDAASQRRKQLRQSQTSTPRTVATSRPSIDFAALRAQLTIGSVLELIGFKAPSYQGAQQRGPCPLHGSTSGTSRCFSVNLKTNVFKCFKCGRQGNALDLWTAAKKLVPYDAAIDLCERLNITVPTLTTTHGNREEEPVAKKQST